MLLRTAVVVLLALLPDGSIANTGTTTTTTTTRYPVPQNGWPEFCKSKNLWEPTANQVADQCTAEHEVGACESSTHGCKWDATAKTCSSVGCANEKEEAACNAIEQCKWSADSHICQNKPPVQDCFIKSERDCLLSREHGCVHYNGKCQSCESLSNTTSCGLVSECQWVASSRKCLSDPEDHTECAPYKTLATCLSKNVCTFIASNDTCVPKDCGAFGAEPLCSAEFCVWKEGDCVPDHLVCSVHSTESACKVLEAECTFYQEDKCYEPRCETAASQADCSPTRAPGCEWKDDKCQKLVETATCLAATSSVMCDDAKAYGCEWITAGCHDKKPDFTSQCTGLNQTACKSNDGCKLEVTDSACKTSNCDTHTTEADCGNDHDCAWNADQHKCAATEAHAAHEDHPPPYNILVIFVIGALGAFFRHNFSDSRIPYTVILFISGATFDGLAKYAISGLQKYVDLADIDPHLLFYIFLPVLIFESAFAVDWFVFKQVLGHCLLLAGPGILCATFLTALIAKYGFWNYGWSWESSLLYGVTLSATDPVAVVALLKELGASPQISTLIEGESLLNDGTAIVIFTVLHQAIAGCTGHIEDEWYQVLGNLIQVAVGGPVLGWVTGWIAVDCLNRVFNDPLIEITTTLVTAYVTFFVAEAYCKVSGVLALVVCGIYMSHRKQCISPEVHHTLHEFWEMSVYLGNTLIFTMAGMIVMGRALDHFQYEDIFYLLITYLGINVIRFFVVKLFSLIYNQFTYKLDTGNMILVAWGGLRGAVGLALALVIAGDERLQMRDEDDPRTILRYKLVFFVAGIVVLTLLLNGISTSWVVKKFKLDQVSDTKKRMMKENFKRLKEGGMDQLEHLKTESALYDVNWLQAEKWVFQDMHDPYNQDEDVFGEGDQHAEAVMHYFKIMHSSVWDQNEEGLLDGDAVRFLLAEINEREKLAKKKEKDLLMQPAIISATDSTVNLTDPASPMGSPISRDPKNMSDRIQCDIQYLDTGRTITFYLTPSSTVLKLKQKIYSEENIPIALQKLARPAEANRKLEDNESVAALMDFATRTVSVSLDRLNPDEDVLLNAQILEQFWNFKEGWSGTMERSWDKVVGIFRRQSYQEQRWTFGFNVAMALVIAHDAVLAKIDNIADPGEANKLKTHAKQVKREVLSQLVQFASQASLTSIAMKTTLAARTVLNHARRKVWEWQKEGLIEDKEADVLVSHVEKKMKALTKVEKKMKPCEQEYILSQMEWYSEASSDLQGRLKTSGKCVRFVRGDLLIKKGDEHREILLITAGSARVHVSRRFDYVGPGYCAGLISSLTSTTKYCDIYAETELLALVFKAETILQWMSKKGNEAFAQALWRGAGVDLAYKVLRGKEPYSKWAPREVRKFVNKGKLLELQKYRPDDKKVSLSHGCYHLLISGHAHDATNQSKDAKMSDLELIEAPCMLPTDCHETYLLPFKWKMPTEENEDGSTWFGGGEGEPREDEVHVLVVEDPSSASARARKYWEKIYKKIRSIKTTAALRGADVKGALEEAFTARDPSAIGSMGANPLKPDPLAVPYNGNGDHQLNSPLLANEYNGLQ